MIHPPVQHGCILTYPWLADDIKPWPPVGNFNGTRLRLLEKWSPFSFEIPHHYLSVFRSWCTLIVFAFFGVFEGQDRPLCHHQEGLVNGVGCAGMGCVKIQDIKRKLNFEWQSAVFFLFCDCFLFFGGYFCLEKKKKSGI